MKVIAGELAKKDGEELLIRPKEIYDGAIPSGNSVAAYNMLKLSRITGDQSLEEHARRIFNAFAGEVMLHPSAHSFLLTALQFAPGASREIVIAGAPDGSAGLRGQFTSSPLPQDCGPKDLPVLLSGMRREPEILHLLLLSFESLLS